MVGRLLLNNFECGFLALVIPFLCFGTLNATYVLLQDTHDASTTCQGGIYCRGVKKCVKASYRCDYHNDCGVHGDDERNCGSCDFERDNCLYVVRSKGLNTFRRTRSKVGLDGVASNNYTSNTTSDGYFMMTIPLGQNMKNEVISTPCSSGACAVDTSTSLESPPLSMTSPRCVLLFDYYYNGNENAVLEIGHKQWYHGKYIESIVLRKELILSELWRKVAINVGQRPLNWSLIFRTNQTHVAIDNIRFKQCAFPRSKTSPRSSPRSTTTISCDPTQVTCSDGACINDTDLCDFNINCKDGSDEKPERCKQYTESCDFEDGRCHWWSTIGDWRRVKASISRSPLVDHTSGTGLGFYMKVEVSKHKGSVLAVLQSVIFKKLKKKCYMKLHYHIDGGYGNMLTIKRRPINSSKPIETLKALSENNNNIWNVAIIELTSETDFQMEIEAHFGIERKGTISIDDVVFCPEVERKPCSVDEFDCGDGQCISCIQNYCICNFVPDCHNKADEANCSSTCDLEEGMCGWKNDHDNLIPWKRQHGYTPTNLTGPPKGFDHTKVSKKGHYLYVQGQSDTPRRDENFPIAKLISPTYHHGSYNCNFSFWYNMYHVRVLHNNDAILKTTFRSNHQGRTPIDTELWMTAKTTYDSTENLNKWVQNVIQLPRCPQFFNVILQVEHFWDTRTDVAVDDLKFECAEDPPLPCDNENEFQCSITKQCVPLESLCDLDRNCCDGSDENIETCRGYHIIDFEDELPEGWVNIQNNYFPFIFTLHQGATMTTDTGPSNDHTFQERNGHYYYSEATSRRQNESCAIGSPTIAATIRTNSSSSNSSSSCTVRFWYNMYGASMGTLSVFITTKVGVPERKIWSLSGNQGKEWKKQHLELYSKHDFQLIFVATIGNDSYSDIALDDISFTPGCNVTENIFGGKKQHVTDKCHPRLYCRPTDSCIPDFEVCDFENDCPNGIDENERICGYPQGFENGLLAWNYLHSYLYPKEFSIAHSSLGKYLYGSPGFEAGPRADATGNDTGNYLYLTKSDKDVNIASTRLQSPWFKNSYANCKLNVFYIMHNYIHNGTKMSLQIKLVNESKHETDLLDIRDDTTENGAIWQQTNISIARRREPFRIDIIASVNEKSQYIAIDEINFINCGRPLNECKENVRNDQFTCRNKICIPKSKLCDFVDDCGDLSDEDSTACSQYIGCNFDADPVLCGFKHNPSADFSWTLNQGITKTLSTGPLHDHTMKTAAGRYLYIEASSCCYSGPNTIRKKGDKAQFVSFPIKNRPNGHCKMMFYYHMYGGGLGHLTINKITNGSFAVNGSFSLGQRTFVTNFTGPPSPSWRAAILDFTNETDIFRVEFEGVVGINEEGDIAIDDIIFTPDCLTVSDGVSGGEHVRRPPYSQLPVCHGKFMCKSTGNCVPLEHCNATTNCKDKSDKDGCVYQKADRSSPRPTRTTIKFMSITALVLLMVVLMVIIVRKHNQKEMIYLFSIFPESKDTNNPDQRIPEYPVMHVPSKKNSTISSVSNPIYDNPVDNPITGLSDPTTIENAWTHKIETAIKQQRRYVLHPSLHPNTAQYIQEPIYDNPNKVKMEPSVKQQRRYLPSSPHTLIEETFYIARQNLH